MGAILNAGDALSFTAIESENGAGRGHSSRRGHSASSIGATANEDHAPTGCMDSFGDVWGGRMAEKRHPYLNTQPGFLSLGSHYVGAQIQGSLQVLGATSCDRYHSPE